MTLDCNYDAAKNTPILRVKRLSDRAAPLVKAYDDPAGTDIAITHLIKVENGIAFFGTDWAFEIPSGYYVELHLRSGTPKNYGWTLANGVGIIDADYRGEIIVQLQPTVMTSIVPTVEENQFESYKYAIVVELAKELGYASHDHPIGPLEKSLNLVQFLFKKKEMFMLEEVGALSETVRGASGFGSSDPK